MFKEREVGYYLEFVLYFKPRKIQKCILLGEVSRKQSLLNAFFNIYSFLPKVILLNPEN